MKCTNCGNNNASYHYSFNLNGQRTEHHLCPECAARLQPDRAFAADARELMGDFGGFFPTMGRLVPSFFPVFVTGAPERTAEPERTSVDPELAAQREKNALREQMKAAAQAEDYEKAAQLRDQLKALEQNKDGAQ